MAVLQYLMNFTQNPSLNKFQEKVNPNISWGIKKGVKLQNLQVGGEDFPTTRPSLLLGGPSHPSHRSNPSQAQRTHAPRHWVQI